MQRYVLSVEEGRQQGRGDHRTRCWKG